MTTTTFTFTISNDVVYNDNDGKLIAEMLKSSFNLDVDSFSVETGKPAKITKGEMIFNALCREAIRNDDEFVMTRQEIADEIGCVVGRIAEIIRDNPDHPYVQHYVLRTKRDRKIKSSVNALFKLQQKVAELTPNQDNDDLTDVLAKSVENLKSA